MPAIHYFKRLATCTDFTVGYLKGTKLKLVLIHRCMKDLLTVLEGTRILVWSQKRYGRKKLLSNEQSKWSIVISILKNTRITLTFTESFIFCNSKLISSTHIISNWLYYVNNSNNNKITVWQQTFYLNTILFLLFLYSYSYH